MPQVTTLTGGAAVCLVYVFLFSIVSGVSRQTEIAPIVWWVFEALGFIFTLFASFLPSDIVRFLGAVFAIMCFLSIHSRISRHMYPYLWKLQTNRLSEVSVEAFSFSNFRQCLFWNETLATIFYNAQGFVEDSDGELYLGWMIVSFLHFICTLFVGDGCVLVLFQVMPYYQMQYQDHMHFSGLLIGIWLYCGLELAYVGHELLLFACGSKLNKYMRHSTPIVSVSLSEFWSVRWNPVIMKLLQSSFYIPLRQRGFHPVLGVLITFCGSAWLHAFPQYVHSFNIDDSVRVALFFIFHGVLVAVERAFIEYTTKYTGSVFSISSQTVYVPKRHSIEFDGEFLCVINFLFFLSIACYVPCYVAASWQEKQSAAFDDVLHLLVISFAVVLLSIVLEHHRNTSCSLTPGRTIAIVFGWLWTVSCLYASLPLLARPAISVLQSSYSASFFAGPVLRHFVESV